MLHFSYKQFHILCGENSHFSLFYMRLKDGLPSKWTNIGYKSGNHIYPATQFLCEFRQNQQVPTEHWPILL